MASLSRTAQELHPRQRACGVLAQPRPARRTYRPGWGDWLAWEGLRAVTAHQAMTAPFPITAHVQMTHLCRLLRGEARPRRSARDTGQVAWQQGEGRQTLPESDQGELGRAPVAPTSAPTPTPSTTCGPA